MSISAPVATLDDSVRRLLVLDSLRRTALAGGLAVVLGLLGGQLGMHSWDDPVVQFGVVVCATLSVWMFVGHGLTMAQARAGYPIQPFDVLISLHQAGQRSLSTLRSGVVDGFSGRRVHGLDHRLCCDRRNPGHYGRLLARRHHRAHLRVPGPLLYVAASQALRPASMSDDAIRRLLLRDSIARLTVAGAVAVLLGLGGACWDVVAKPGWPVVLACMYAAVAVDLFLGHAKVMTHARDGQAPDVLQFTREARRLGRGLLFLATGLLGGVLLAAVFLFLLAFLVRTGGLMVLLMLLLFVPALALVSSSKV
jgi:hypothetical protein